MSKAYDATKEHAPFDRSAKGERNTHPNKNLSSKHPYSGKTAARQDAEVIMSHIFPIFFVVDTETGVIDKTVERNDQPLPLAKKHFVMADHITLARYNELVDNLPKILLTDVQF